MIKIEIRVCGEDKTYIRKESKDAVNFEDVKEIVDEFLDFSILTKRL